MLNYNLEKQVPSITGLIDGHVHFSVSRTLQVKIIGGNKKIGSTIWLLNGVTTVKRHGR